MGARYIKINREDNVAVATVNLDRGEEVTVEEVSIILKSTIPKGHKFSLTSIERGANVIKYGYPIGHLITAVAAGELIDHTTLKTNLDGVVDYNYCPVEGIDTVKVANGETPTFKGYIRSNGDVAVRNDIYIVPTVGCVNGTINELAAKLKSETNSEGVDSIVALGHNYGCSQLGDDHENSRKILRDIVLHPNAAAVLIVGLGCENNQLSEFIPLLGRYDRERIRFIETQNLEDEIEIGMGILRELYSIAVKDRRVDVPISKLRVGLKCGGSDGLSGITANPLLGAFSDYLISYGGTAVLTEVPEMFGAEQILMNRCSNREVFDRCVNLIDSFKKYFIDNNQPIFENPSPGNKMGGISTLEDKSLGCTQKCGTSVVEDVLEYGDILKSSGLNLLSSPGNDLVAATALAASGCHIVLFTTGRGTPFGTFVPTVKISTNSDLSERKPKWIDFDAGVLVDDISMDQLLPKFSDYLLSVAGGTLSNSEKSNYKEIAIFKTGVTL